MRDRSVLGSAQRESGSVDLVLKVRERQRDAGQVGLGALTKETVRFVGWQSASKRANELPLQPTSILLL